MLKARAACQSLDVHIVVHTTLLGWPHAPLACCTWRLGAQEVRFEALYVTDTVVEALQRNARCCEAASLYFQPLYKRPQHVLAAAGWAVWALGLLFAFDLLSRTPCACVPGHNLRQVELIHLLDSVPVAAWEAQCECSQGSALSGDSTWTRPSVRMDTPAVLAAGGQPVDSTRGQLPPRTVGVG